MIERSLITRTEREQYLSYDRQRRILLLRIVIPAFLVVCAVVLVLIAGFLVVARVPEQTREGLLITDVMLLGVMAILAFGLLSARRERLGLAAALVSAASGLGTAASVAIWSRYLGLDPFAMIELTPFSVVIVLAGLLGDIWVIIGAAFAMNVVTVLLLLIAPRAGGVGAVINQEMPLILPVSLVYQWLFAALIIAIWFIFQRTLREIGTAYDRAKQLDVLKDEFIASVNHELRTPLMTMQTYLETMREQLHRLPPEQLAVALDHVCRVGDSLVDLVKSILSARRIDQDAVGFTPEEVSVPDALAAALQLVNPREASLAGRDLRIQVPEQLTLWGEHIRLQQILTNLLSNAAKYSPTGTPIEVVAQVVQEETSGGTAWRRTVPQSLVEISVRDHGQGIPSDQIPLLFNRFVRLPRDLASKITGTGLGLYLCRVMAEAMGGRIWVASAGVDGEGSTFYVRLPASPPGEAGAPPPSRLAGQRIEKVLDALRRLPARWTGAHTPRPPGAWPA
jgi:signal transduction histidine kinase